LILEKLFQEKQKDIAEVFIINGDYKGKTGIKSLFFVGSKTCFPFLVSKCLQIAFFKLAKLISSNAILDVEKLASVNGVDFSHFASISEERAFERARFLKPDLIVSVSCPQRIPERVLEVSVHGGINIHSSLLPKYGGLAPYYWVLSKGENVTGTTVHRIVHNFDEGNVLVQDKIEIPKRISALELFEDLARIGSIALLKAIQKVEENDQGTIQDQTQKNYFSHPDLKSYIGLKKNGFSIMRTKHLLKLIWAEMKNNKI